MYCPNCNKEYDGKFCQDCGAKLIEKPSAGGFNLNFGDANAISGGINISDSHDVTNIDNSVHNTTNNNTTVNNYQSEVFGASDVNVKKLLKEAIEYYDDEDYFNAVKLFEQIADKDIKAQYYLGLCYEHGDGVIEDEEEAAKWFGKAASYGYPNAQYELARIYLSDNVKLYDIDKGIKFLNMSASQGYKDAMSLLGAFYLLGAFVEKDYERAYYYYSRLKPDDYPVALYGRAVACFEKDSKEACKWLKKASEESDLPEMDPFSWNVTGKGCLLWAKILCSNINGYGRYDKGIEYLKFVIEHFDEVAEEAQKFLEQIEKNEEGNIFRNYGDYQSDGKGNYIVNDGVCSLIKTEYGRKKSIIPDDAVSVVLPTSLKKIGESAFSCYKYLERVTIPDSVTVIEDSAFSSCNSLKKIELPNSITIIDEYAFFNTGLEEITIPDSVTSIGTSAFSSCERLKSVTLSNNLNYLGRDSFRECKKLTKVVIPNTLVKIEVQTFLECTMLSEVTLPETIQTIEDSAFYGCRSLHRINMPQNLREIGDDAFCGCRSLTSISIPRGVKSIGEDAFEDCTKITYLSETESNKKAGELTDKNQKLLP